MVSVPWASKTDHTVILEIVGGKGVFNNVFFSALAGITWYFQFMFYGMGTTRMGEYDFASWTIHMAFIIVFSNMWGLDLERMERFQPGYGKADSYGSCYTYILNDYCWILAITFSSLNKRFRMN